MTDDGGMNRWMNEDLVGQEWRELWRIRLAKTFSWVINHIPAGPDLLGTPVHTVINGRVYVEERR